MAFLLDEVSGYSKIHFNQMLRLQENILTYRKTGVVTVFQYFHRLGHDRMLKYYSDAFYSSLESVDSLVYICRVHKRYNLMSKKNVRKRKNSWD